MASRSVSRRRHAPICRQPHQPAADRHAPGESAVEGVAAGGGGCALGAAPRRRRSAACLLRGRRHHKPQYVWPSRHLLQRGLEHCNRWIDGSVDRWIDGSMDRWMKREKYR
eukprot:scaffold118913_cov62-Phaeocystis_antarctica.AAC.2